MAATATNAHDSPSRKYLLQFADGDWTVIRVSDRSILRTGKRTIGSEKFSFFQRGEHEWLQMSNHTTRQSFLNLETLEYYDSSQFESSSDEEEEKGEVVSIDEDIDDWLYTTEYCWHTVIADPTGTTLAVPGCTADDKSNAFGEIQFFDFSDPSNGWPRLPIEGLPGYCPLCRLSDTNRIYHWIDKEGIPVNEIPAVYLPVFEYTCVSETGDLRYRVHLHRDGMTMQAALVEASPECQAFIEKMKLKYGK